MRVFVVGNFVVLFCFFMKDTIGYDWVDGPVEKSRELDLHCPGLFCGRTQINDTMYSACGKCERGWRVYKGNLKHVMTNVTSSICQECREAPEIKDWLFLAFHVVLVACLHWMAIDLTAKRQKLTQAIMTLHACAAGEVVLAASVTVLLTHPAGTFRPILLKKVD